MEYKLTILELGKALKKIEEDCGLKMLIKANLSGGWMTMVGEAIIVSIPKEYRPGLSAKFDNIVSIKLKDENSEGSMIKLTGGPEKKFNVKVEPAKYREIPKNGIGLNQVKINESECTLKIDDSIVFTIKAKAEDIMNIIG
ncbi:MULTISPECIES: UDP-N-acetylglucosamine pyrophosphorylase [Clostridium]|uniref:UDP-N-acetylglucosamine pyrophosphorylase n=1 Tax=Clostridium cibarium TaxID=2762247 RepID=A0ABR8PW60_9CLOT|nr:MULTISPECIES: UDP-N-acetylglucosamine pyrophosphorylase [Clostridium]MBD7912433.1 UDP-N-acetylglucosamine pyrophosphorylase [Clostridium cibarium]